MQTKLEESFTMVLEGGASTGYGEDRRTLSLSMDLESSSASLEAAETRNAVMQEELRLTNEALSRSTNEAASMETLQAELTAIADSQRDRDRKISF